MRTTDAIERFILSLLAEDDQIELRRGELAEFFSCAPSQINYVLATRFTPERGYLIQSKRGGGGYIRIKRVDLRSVQYISFLLSDSLTEAITQEDARYIIAHLLEQEIIDKKQAALMLAATSDSAFAPFGSKGLLRTGVLRAMLFSLLKEETE